MGEAKHDGLAVPGRIALAHELPFTVGNLRVDPSRRQIESDIRRETLEPRVMQVLVALKRADGRIVTRDELTEWCWDGRIVGDDAINRTIFRLRQIAAGIGGGSFAIETVTKVGYRIAETAAGAAAAQQESDQHHGKDHRPPVTISRRSLGLGAGALAAATVAGGTLWFVNRGHRPKPEALEAFRRGDIAQRVGIPDQTRQAVAYFERAVRLDPDWGAAWGALALAYTHNLDGFAEAQLASLPPRIRSAAQRALELDRDNADARLALACIPPYFRNWTKSESELSRIHERYPSHWLAAGRLAFLYYQVGRWLDGAALHKQVVATEPLIAGPYAFAARALANAGRLQEAEAILASGRERWPAHPLLFYTGFEMLLFSGRPASAAAMLADPETVPSGMSPEEKGVLTGLAKAVESREAGAVAKVVGDARSFAAAEVKASPDSAQILSVFGERDQLFPMLDRYFFDRGPFGSAAPIGPYTRRATDFLFSAPMANARADPRFAKLTENLGLDDYWRRTNSGPTVTAY